MQFLWILAKCSSGNSFCQLPIDLSTVGGTAEAHYNNAITASITYWGGTPAEAAAYLTQPAVAYTTAIGTYRQKIGTQAWLAYFQRGISSS